MTQIYETVYTKKYKQKIFFAGFLEKRSSLCGLTPVRIEFAMNFKKIKSEMSRNERLYEFNWVVL